MSRRNPEILEVAFQKIIQVLFPFPLVLFCFPLLFFAKSEKSLHPDFEAVRDGKSLKQPEGKV